MQQQMIRHEGAEEELKQVKAQLSTLEKQRDRAIDELREIKKRTSSNESMTSSSESLQIAEGDSNMKETHKVHDEDKAVLVEKIEVLEKELRQALEGEAYNKKALDDLAMALKEVTNESIPTKEQLKKTERELEVVREEAENFKTLVKCTEKTCEAILSESEKESERLKNTVDRLKLERKESVLARNEKEEEFVKCINKVEGKEFANVGKDEACNDVQDSLQEEGSANNVGLAKETERLGIKESEANGSVKGLKLALTMGSKRETRDEKEGRERKMTNSLSFDPKCLLRVDE